MNKEKEEKAYQKLTEKLILFADKIVDKIKTDIKKGEPDVDLKQYVQDETKWFVGQLHPDEYEVA